MAKIFLIVSCAAAARAVTVQCQFHTMSWGQPLGYIYTCSASVINSVSGNVVESITGSHAAGNTNTDVQGLDVTYQELSTVPKNIELFFPNLKALSWRQTSLSTVFAVDFKPFPNLLFFFSNYNPIVSITGNLFRYTPLLQYVGFQSNSLGHVGPELLTGLNGLVTANFQNNPCVNVNAVTPATIAQLNRDLPVLCPTLGPECPIECQSIFENLEDNLNDLTGALARLEDSTMSSNTEIDELLRVAAQQKQINSELQEEYAKLVEQIDKLQAEAAEQQAINSQLQQINADQLIEIENLNQEMLPLKAKTEQQSEIIKANAVKINEIVKRVEKFVK